MSEPRYDSIGHNYARFRREDPGIAAVIHEALGDAKTVVNVGAGSGSYEPTDRYVLAIEPSDVMAAQRVPPRVPAIAAGAASLPLRDGSVDAAMSVLSLHHWDEAQERGVQELRRVARDRVVIVTYDAEVWAKVWLLRDYLPEIAALDLATFPPPARVAQWLGGEVRISPIPLSRDTPDWMLGSYWAHPERVLDPAARAATSGFARQPAAVIDRVVAALGADLASGAWDARNGALRQLADYDVGLRVIVAEK